MSWILLIRFGKTLEVIYFAAAPAGSSTKARHWPTRYRCKRSDRKVEKGEGRVDQNLAATKTGLAFPLTVDFLAAERSFGSRGTA